ncbi:WRKY transcription factor-like protein [Gossypium australe]|uniref:WRKY transcription factor-like protein n=1 Tax=Gossypium australe TaxID=47621 RepID=A0A5B6V4P3_9ROSI|nr:WRKY transcription factor-like protein [Gossypium australe]
MKLLGWMQHKLRPSNIEPFKDFTIGNYCTCLLAHSSLSDHQGYEYGSRYSTLTITLSGKAIQAAASVEECGKTILCPLQGYLFGSSVELPEPRFEVKKEKESLAELFYRTKVAEEYNNSPMKKRGKEDTQTKQTTKPVKHLIKRILKKFHSSSGKDETNSFSTKKKLQKVIKLFHRKIHPENSIAERESKMNNAPYSDNDYTGGDNMRFPQGSRSKAGLGNNNKKTISKLPQYGLTGCTAATENGEHWIKTDADCEKTATNAS